jgi:hypothetical protein
VRVRREPSPPATYRLLLPRLSMARSCLERVSLQLGSLKRPGAATSASQGGVSPPTVDEVLLEYDEDDEEEDEDDVDDEDDEDIGLELSLLPRA